MSVTIKNNSFERIKSIDIVRGLVMVIMALDHTRELIFVDALALDPTDLKVTTPILFFTRWITHLCAPTFVFLSGVSVYLSFSRQGNLTKSRNFLISRGLWLILLEFTLITFAISFDIHFQIFVFQVIGAIGFSFIILGLCLRLKPEFIGLLGLLIILMLHIFPALHVPVLSQPEFIPLPWGANLLMAYPPILWLSIMFLGFGVGKWFLVPSRLRLFLYIGVSCILLFAGIRYLNGVGDPVQWAAQKDGLFTFLSFVNLTKYPPSLDYDLLFLGIMFLLLALAEQLKGKAAHVLHVFGSVPLFYYLLHWYLIRIVSCCILFAQGFGPADFEFGFNFGRPKATNGLPLWGVYLVWIGIVTALYPACLWYKKYKAANQHHKKWLRYL
ncbi:DUF1624 domain-containing protein [Pedobacter metabolipauper]|uniref:Putative membrane protein n=1 Tax=Pedobacter metabolipauper TaxID=425513 RepID=A0A4R6STL0_9SPHI|nr:heparan-alpha-glucosaminide N-acetyltransferase domain-containing protein [Pedobacter metabolipauper]TDQ08795.1 putative membrane protein [Pedobacter metabolipauper]